MIHVRNDYVDHYVDVILIYFVINNILCYSSIYVTPNGRTVLCNEIGK